MTCAEPPIGPDRRLTVLLIHGLSRTPLSMFRLARHLRRHGFATEMFGYASLVERYDRIVGRLRERLASLADRGPYAIVGHSLGGLLARAALGAVDYHLPEHLVMLGTPNNRSKMAEWAAEHTPWRLVVGQAGRKLADPSFFKSLPIPPIPYTVVAGSKGSRLMRAPFGDEANDTLVAVSETRLGAGERHVVLPVGHTFMMNKSPVKTLVVGALQTARVG